MIDFTGLQITAPMLNRKGQAMTVSGADALTQFPDFVQPTPNGGVRFIAPTKGATTKSVHRTRTEWKGDPFFLADEDEHSNLQWLTVVEANYVGKFVISQMHDQDADDPTVKVIWKDGQVWVGIRTDDTDTDPDQVCVHPNTPIGTRLCIIIDCTRTGLITVSAYVIGGNAYQATAQITGPQRLARAHVFHGGAYNQVDQGGSKEPVGDRTVVDIDTISIMHWDNETVYEKSQHLFDALCDHVYPNGLSIAESRAQIQVYVDSVDALPADPRRAALYPQVKTLLATLKSK